MLEKETSYQSVSYLHCTGSLFTILGIFACCIADGLLTAGLIASGAYEANPVMVYFMQMGLKSFLTVKYAFTASGVFLLVLLRDRKIFGEHIVVSDLLPLLQFFYILLLIYEAFLLATPIHRNFVNNFFIQSRDHIEPSVKVG